MVPDDSDGDAIAVFDGLLTQALREIRSPAATPADRIAWAGVAAYALEHLPESEERVTKTLSTAGGALNLPEVVERLIGGAWSCTGCRSNDGTWERLRRCVSGLADRAIRGEHWATFARLAHTAVRIDAVERHLSREWERGIRAAFEVPSASVSLYLFALHYLARFQPDRETVPDWLQLLRSDRRLQEAFDQADVVERSLCPVCKRAGAP